MPKKRFILSGQVQGVGFRPFVYRLAHEIGLCGFVSNGPEGVDIQAEGSQEQLAAFEARLVAESPPLSVINNISVSELDEFSIEIAGEFKIIGSSSGEAHAVLISPDTATCPDCLREIEDPQNRRCGYAFTNCTNCGPRYSITRSMPYDRPFTSMACFPLCPECLREYNDPSDRRFHAQPNACPVCGPQIWFAEAESHPFAESNKENSVQGQKALEFTVESLLNGKIVGIKGLGGFHLVCDATNQKVVAELRERKKRPHKPFAIMLANFEAARSVVTVNEYAEKLLSGPESPIVLCQKILTDANTTVELAANLSLDTDLLGIMLPYTPLQHILLQSFSSQKAGLAALVMTSGNRGGEPIALSNREAMQNLEGIADCFLLHDRDILVRTDDSVIGPAGFIRRSRGFVPRPLPLPDFDQKGKAPTILALGAELKNTICVARGEWGFVSQHIGDLQNLETASFQEEMVEHFLKVLQVSPDYIVCDQHPDFMSTTLAVRLSELYKVPLLKVQHHLAHAHAVLAENKHQGTALILALDGSGFSPDGSIWGGELLLIDSLGGKGEFSSEPKRLGHMANVPLPGGEAAIKEPWRLAFGLALRLGLPLDDFSAWLPPKNTQAQYAVNLLPTMLEKSINTPESSSCGRLFDAVSALLGFCTDLDGRISYEGQAAIRLEQAAALSKRSSERENISLHCPVISGPANTFILDTHSLFADIYSALKHGLSASSLALAFHEALAGGLADLALAGANVSGIFNIGLSGGVMNNLVFASALEKELEGRGFKVFTHRNLPVGDACVSYGQTAWARYLLR